MSISAVSSQAQPLPALQSQIKPKKNDHDGDEVNGVDPANEKTKEATKSANPNVGQNVNQYA